jgi:multidrug efflux pump subunit AcrA (membrane-fusion protein)
MNNNEKKRGWVKNAAIIFLAVMLALTFFSNTIMNWSLPEVSGQYAGYGTITTSIRGTGTVKANMAYNVQLEETRDIKKVLVKEGDTVTECQPLFDLEDSDSEELEQAKTTLDTLEYNYKTKLLQNSATDYAQSENEITDLKEDLEDAKAQREGLEEYWAVYEKAQTDTETAQDKVDTLSEKVNDLQALLTELSSGKDGDSEEIAAKLDVLSAENDKLKDAQEVYSTKQEAYNDIKAEMPMTLAAAEDAVTSAERSYKSYVEKENTADNYYHSIKDDPTVPASTIASAQSSLFSAMNDTYYQAQELKEAKEKLEEIKKLDAQLKTAKTEMDKAKAEVKACEAAVSAAQKAVNSLVSVKEKELKASLDEAEAALKAANSTLKAAQKAEAAAKEDCSLTVKQADENIRTLERKLQSAQLTLDSKKQSDYVSSQVSKLELEKAYKEIDKQRALVAELESKSVGAQITAKYAGIIASVDCVAGDTVKAGTTLCTINVDGKGFTVGISVTNEQSREVHIGDKATITNNWWSDAEAVLAAIKPDFDNPGQKKILEFTVSGDVTEGQTLSLIVGERENNFNLVVPNSAVREDSEGNFILVAKAKTTPLGNRYIATRVDVTVLAKDSYNTALDAGTDFGFEYVITTSTAPLEAGMQVRLAETE